MASFGRDLRWAPAGAGRLAVWHRPRFRSIPQLPALGCQRLVTLLSAREGAEAIGAAAVAAGLRWTWLPLDGAAPPTGRPHERAAATIAELSRRLDDGESILIHCSAGIHRTGMVAYALLRHRGASETEALAEIDRLRPVTRAGLSPAAVAWGHAIAAGRRSAG